MNERGDLCVVIKVAARPTETRWSCSPPVMIAEHAFRDLGISMISASPIARPWLGVVEGLVRQDVATVRITFEDGAVEQVSPNADGGFILDRSRTGTGGPPTQITALSAGGTELETYPLN
jgi:hypothetical protein